MKIRLSLFIRTLMWFFTTVMVIGALMMLLFHFQIRIKHDSPLAAVYGARMLAVGSEIAQDLNASSPDTWDGILKRFARSYKIDLQLVARNGACLAGCGLDLPTEVTGMVRQQFHFQPHRLLGPPRDRMPPLPHAHFMLRTSEPKRYWVGVPLLIFLGPARPPIPLLLLASSEKLTAGGLFFDPLPWLFLMVLVVTLAALFWLPFVRSITQPVARMTKAAGEIASGRFDMRLDGSRSDEIGRLSQAINDMSMRLEGYVNGRKRFLGDIAHELASPLARIQLGLGILAQQAEHPNSARLADVICEAEELAALVEELLEFSRAEISPSSAKLNSIPVAQPLRRAVLREGAEDTDIRLEVDEALCALADPELLTRGVANVLRNSVRYAGAAGPITVKARQQEAQVIIEIRDCGPGVPDEALPQLFEPFYRPEDARSRETGGAGLGLAIVKTCIEACQGMVTARNVPEGGFEVTIALKFSLPAATSKA